MKRDTLRQLKAFACYMACFTVAIVATHATVTIHPIFALFAIMGFLGTFIAGYYPR